MPFIFKDDIKKITMRAAGANALRKLRKFLDTNEPDLVYWLHRLWNNQGRAITYKELREAIMNGYLTQELIEAWQQDYSKFVVDHLRPAWEHSSRKGNGC